MHKRDETGGRETEIILSGELGRRFGKRHMRHLDNAAEAGVALAHTLPGFERFMIQSEERGLRFAVFLDGKNVSQEALTQRGVHSFDVIRIVPVVVGSKKAGALQLIIGVAIIIASIWMPGIGIAASDMLFAAGAATALGGAIQMLSPQPAGLSRSESPDNKASYGFGSAKNTTAQGYPVGLLYGKRRIGGAIISAGIYVEDQQ
ncbi:tail assembly protein [Klebsiella sp. PL-2018]|uniref:tail assembly protein n=1 Tax=Klebsiella sp. PL-2018 TaxID=2851540 RepID=UPI001C24E076|nr:tail assembly protein [Klebsiella sp. PL-2018]QXC99313.1 Phage tail assembly protein I [Klebsiella sp. PL-2018]